jgi:6-phosphogluconate dehydrogenase
MQIGIVGLGRMGANIARRLLRNGHGIVAYDHAREAAETVRGDGAAVAEDLQRLVEALSAPRHIWLMLPAGAPTEEAFQTLLGLVSPGDLIVDGGNSYWKHDLRRAAEARARGVAYVDAGVSGGVWGLERGYCLMVGGEEQHVERLRPVLDDLAPPSPPLNAFAGGTRPGFVHAGGVGSGHFAKMVHNGIEYGMMQALAEGLDILKHADAAAVPEPLRLSLDVAAIAQAWRQGSVIQSWLLDLAAAALSEDPQLSAYQGQVGDSGEGRWTVEAAMDEEVAADVLATAVFARFRSRQTHTFGEKVLSAMRAGFGGHKEGGAPA